jgi:deleted-in-malignant-brain-tumors protein 1
LVNGTNVHEGRVEICANNKWGTVCDDLWDNLDAQVVCQQLGYTSHDAIAFGSAHFGQGTGIIALDDVVCTGKELSLFKCSHNSINTHNCDHSEDAGVRCYVATEVTKPPQTNQSLTAGVSTGVILLVCSCLILTFTVVSAIIYRIYKKDRRASIAAPPAGIEPSLPAQSAFDPLPIYSVIVQEPQHESKCVESQSNNENIYSKLYK